MKCNICFGEDDIFWKGDNVESYTLKKGWFNEETFSFCRECQISLNKKYNSTFCSEDDPFSERLLEELNDKEWAKNAPSDNTLSGAICDDIIDFKTFSKTIRNINSDRKSREDELNRKEEAGKLKAKKNEERQLKKLKNSIIDLLIEKAVKMPASDIDAFLKHQNVDEIKELCEQMYHNSEISRTANYRYFILSEQKRESKKASASKSEEVDIEKELEKLKGLLDKGLITQEAYDAKMNQLLGL